MPKSPNQKLKLLYLMEILLQQTDERHPMTVPEMISELARHGVAAERKSIYNDLESLRTFGLDIVQTKSRTTGYYIGARSFEVPELKLLVDSVQSSKFITHKKTLALIKKIEGLASIYDAQLLQRQVYVRGRVKSMNESVYYNVDEIADAISRDRQIRFHYFEYTIDKQRHYRKDGAFYIVSPMALMWDNENYYLLAWDAEAQLRKHYRVDKMTDISALDAPREGAIFIALAQVLSYLKLYELPQGGSITIEMLPIFLYCARWGFGPGMLASFAYSILQALLSSTYAWTWQSLIGDYLLAFTALGLAGSCAKLKGGFFYGTVVGSVARFLVHYVVGATVWAEYMPETFFGLTMTTPWFYSALYNGSFMLIDMVLVLVIGALLWKPLRKYITGEDLHGAANAKNEG